MAILLFITFREFLIRSVTCIVLELYITYPTFDGSGQDWSLYFQTWSFGWNSMMFSCSFLMNVLASYLVPLNMKRGLTLRFLTAGVPSFYHFMKTALSRRSLPLFQEIPIAADAG